MSVPNMIRVFVLLLMVLLCDNGRGEDPKLVDLLLRSPLPANTIAYIHPPSLIRLMADAKMPSKLSAQVNELWLVSELDTESLRPRWEAGYGILNSELDADSLARVVNGYVDTVAGKQVVWSPRQMYLVPIGEHRLGILRPANRSVLSQWIDPGVNVNYSGYLVDHSKQPESYLSLMVAIELQDSISAVPLEKRLSDFQSLKSQPARTVAGILASVKGISIIVGRRSLADCILAIEFQKSPASLMPIANELLAEILERNGTAAPEVLTWKVKVDANTLSFQGPISQGSLDGVLGIFSLQGQAEEVATSLGDKIVLSKSGSDQTAYTTKHHFDKIGEVVDRVREHKAQTTGARALWNEQQARRIDDMGTLNVDPQVIQYGADVAELLRSNSLTIRSANISAGQIKASQRTSSGYYGSYGYSWNNAYDVAASKRVTDANARGAAYSDYTSVLTTIDKMTADLRRAMTDKYKMQF